MLNKSVNDVLKGANKFISELEKAAKYEEAKAAEKNKTVVKLQAEVQELDKSAKHGKIVADRFKALLTVNEDSDAPVAE